MIIIFGRRQYGRVDACGGQYAHTTFAHIYYLPIIPVSSFWVTNEAGNQRVGFPIPLHGKSVLAGYLRIWAPLAACGMLAGAAPAIGVPAAILLAALSVWAWTWRSLRGEYAVRRSDFNRLAFGMRCDPKILEPSLRGELQQNLAKRWERLGATHSPNDVGKYGAKDPGEAVTAYGLLRLSAIERGGRDEAEAAERILAGMHDKLPSTDDGPYREAQVVSPAAVHDQIASAAANVEARTRGEMHAAAIAAQRKRAPMNRAKAFMFGGAIAAAVAVGGLSQTYNAVGDPATGTIADISAHHVPGEFATVTCGQSMQYGDLMEGSHVSHRVFVCAEGDRMMAVLADADTQELPGTITGELVHPSYDDRTWWTSVDNGHIEPNYLELGSPTGKRVEAAICGLLLVGGMAGFGLGLRTRIRSKRAAAAV